MENIHIVPIGLDSTDRFIEGFKKYPPSKVIFILGVGEAPEEIAAEKIKDEVEGQMGTYERRETKHLDLFTFSSALSEFFNLIKEHNRRGVSFYINISSSTKIITQAAYMAAALSDANVRLYYVKADEYLSTQILSFIQEKKEADFQRFMDDLKEKGIVYLSTGAKSVVEIPVLRMKHPTSEDLDILEILKINEGKVSSTAKVIRLLEKLGPKESISTSDRNKYSKRVKTLKKSGFITQEPEGVSKNLILTDSGKVIAEIGDLLKKEKSNNGSN